MSLNSGSAIDFEYILNHGEVWVIIAESGLEHLIDAIRPNLTRHSFHFHENPPGLVEL